MNIVLCDRNDLLKNFFLSEKVFDLYHLREYKDGRADILIVDEHPCEKPCERLEAEACFLPIHRIRDMIGCFRMKNAISCGMSSKDSVTYSSIGEERALICIQRKIIFLDKVYEPCEFPVFLHKNISEYQNLIVGTLRYLVSDGSSYAAD